jgi:hypothetical protein
LTELYRRGRCVRIEERAEEAFFKLGVEDRDANALVDSHVGVRPRDLLDQSVEAESSQVVGHLAQ